MGSYHCRPSPTNGPPFCEVSLRRRHQVVKLLRHKKEGPFYGLDVALPLKLRPAPGQSLLSVCHHLFTQSRSEFIQLGPSTEATKAAKAAKGEKQSRDLIVIEIVSVYTL